MTRTALTVAAILLFSVATTPALAQDANDWGFDPNAFDPGALLADGRELLLRAPDASVDGLFQAIHESAKTPRDASTLCELFDPDAQRSLDGYNRIASQLSEQSRMRFADAATTFFLTAAQSPRQPYDANVATQALKAAGVRAALLNDGFLAGLNGSEQDARCRSVGWLMDAMATRPVGERASVMRLLLSQGIEYLALGAGTQR